MADATTTQAVGVHFCGSILAADEKEAFTLVSSRLGRRLRRIPDGEPGIRNYWAWWQSKAFGDIPEILIKAPTYNAPRSEVSQATLDALAARIGPAETHFDTHAIQSYAVFKELRDQGVIAPGTRFQVSIASTLGVMSCCFLPEYRPTVEPRYMQGLLSAIAAMQAHIPHADLAIQFDVAGPELSILDPVPGGTPVVEPWWTPARDGVFERLVRLAAAVEPGVELGFHLCYGDLAHAHFKEPADAGVLADVALTLLKQVPRPVNFIHMPVPVARDDAAFFAPLAPLQEKRGSTEIYLGLVHYGDLEGTRRRIAAAGRVLKGFGVATECGMGRTPAEHCDSILGIMEEVAAPAF